MLDQILNEYLDSIRRKMIEVADDAAGRIVLDAEVGDGYHGADLFYLNRDRVVRHRAVTKPLKGPLIRFWEQWQKVAGEREWRFLSVIVDGGKIDVEVTYPEDADPDEFRWRRQPRIVKKYFGDTQADYSQPY